MCPAKKYPPEVYLGLTYGRLPAVFVDTISMHASWIQTYPQGDFGSHLPAASCSPAPGTSLLSGVHACKQRRCCSCATLVSGPPAAADLHAPCTSSAHFYPFIGQVVLQLAQEVADKLRPDTQGAHEVLGDADLFWPALEHPAEVVRRAALVLFNTIADKYSDFRCVCRHWRHGPPKSNSHYV